MGIPLVRVSIGLHRRPHSSLRGTFYSYDNAVSIGLHRRPHSSKKLVLEAVKQKSQSVFIEDLIQDFDSTDSHALCFCLNRSSQKTSFKGVNSENPSVISGQSQSVFIEDLIQVFSHYILMGKKFLSQSVFIEDLIQVRRVF